MSAEYTKVHFRPDFFIIIRKQTIHPDQAAPLGQSDLGPYCLRYRLCNLEHKQMSGADKHVLTGMLRVANCFVHNCRGVRIAKFDFEKPVPFGL